MCWVTEIFEDRDAAEKAQTVQSIIANVPVVGLFAELAWCRGRVESIDYSS